MYFLVFDHNVSSNTFYVQYCKALGTTAGIESYFTDLEASGTKKPNVHSSTLFTKHPVGALVNRYYLGIDLSNQGIDSDLTTIVNKHLQNTPFSSNTQPGSWSTYTANTAAVLDSLGTWARGWGGLLTCWSVCTESIGGRQRTGRVLNSSTGDAETSMKLAMNSANFSYSAANLNSMYDAAVEMLNYLVVYYSKAFFKSVLTKYSNIATVPVLSCDNKNLGTCVANLTSTSIDSVAKTLTGRVLCDKCWHKLLANPSEGEEQKLSHAEHVVLIANDLLDPKACPVSTISFYKGAWCEMRSSNELVLTDDEREDIEQAFNSRVPAGVRIPAVSS